MLYKINSTFEAIITLTTGKKIEIKNEKLFDLLYLLETSYSVEITEERVNLLIKYGESQITEALKNSSFRKIVIEELEEI